MARLAPFGRLFPYLRPYRVRMAAAALLVMGAAGVNLSMLWVIRRLVDTVLVQRDAAALNTAIAELGALFLVQGLLIMGHSYLTASAGQRIMADFRTHLFDHLQGLSLGFFARQRTGELMSRLMNDVGALQTALTEIPIDLAKQVVTLVGGLAILFVMNWRLCLLILLLLPALVLIARFFGRRLKALSTGIQDETARASTILEGVLSRIRIVKSFVREDYERARFGSQGRRSLDVVFTRARIMALFVAASGSEKTTLINLIHRFYDPVAGVVTIDGYDLKSVTLQSLYQQIALVPQEMHRFGGTIRDNIRYGRVSASDEEIVAAARAANAHDFITALPDGYGTLVGEKGVNLSGGQRQRIAIARAVLKDPRILILDEATSSLDTESESLVQDALDRRMKGRATFVVAHGLSTIQQADRPVA